MFLKIKVFVFLIIAKFITLIIKLLKKGSGTALPGYLVENYAPDILSYFNKKYKKTILISGTNGKTTTRAILVSLYEKNGFKVVTNKGGANIFRGLASSMLLDLNFNLSVKSQILILEVEEATLPKLKNLLKVDQLILTNVFRDQLDAYGEIDTTLEYFKDFLTSQDCEVIINGDDPKLLEIVKPLENINFVYCGVESTENPKYEGSIKQSVDYNFRAKEITYHKGLMKFKIELSEYVTQLSGVYNIYNITFALAAFDKINKNALFNQKIISELPPVFGRGERFNIHDSDTILYLVKNPEGFNQVLQYIKKAFIGEKINFYFLVNDNIADSRDVSWLWDVEFEKYREQFLVNKVQVEEIFVAGSRADDILLRLEYADFHSISYGNNLGKIENAVDNIIKNNTNNIVFATYTSMLEFRVELSKHINISSITANGN